MATDTLDPEEMVTVARFSDPASAHLALSLLQDSGIDAFLSGEEANSLLPQTLGARLQVRREDEATASELLNNPVDMSGEASLADDGNDL